MAGRMMNISLGYDFPHVFEPLSLVGNPACGMGKKAIFTAYLLDYMVQLFTRVHFVFAIACLFFVVEGCTPTRFVKPLRKGEKRLGGNIGGPMVRLNGTPIPVPLSSLYYGQGITDSLTVYGGVHVTSAIYGNVQTDVGGLYHLYHNDSSTYGFNAGFALNTAFHVRANSSQFEGLDYKPDLISNFRVWPQINLEGYWNFKKKKEHYLYYGLSTWLEIRNQRESSIGQNKFIFITPHVGITWCGPLWNTTFELQYLAPYYSTQGLVVPYVPVIGRYGTLGFHLTLSKKLVKREYIEEDE
jgi:hypothetical protein